MPSICSIIVNYHQPDLTRRAVASVLNAEGIETRAILIDNESDGAWAREIYAEDPRVSIRANAANIGFGAACNQGIALALEKGCEAVFLLNSDAVAEPDALRKLADAAQETGLAAPKILLPDGRIYAAGGIVEMSRARCRNKGIYEKDLAQYDRPETLRFASACALMIARRALETGIRFHEPFFLYYEDADFCLRLADAGFRVAYTPAARVLHLESASTGKARNHRLLYYDARNRFLFLRRRAAFPTRAVGSLWLFGTLLFKISRAALKGRREEVRALAHGLLDGILGKSGKGPI